MIISEQKTFAHVSVESLVTQSTRPKRTRQFTQRSEEKVVSCAFEEENSTGERTKHRYTCIISDPHNIGGLIKKSRFQSFHNFLLNIEAHKLKRTTRIDRLAAVEAIRTKLTPYNFQLKTALQVINEMNANAILADEVGLGKTIEAGLIMKELLLRGEINSILIVAPKSLLSQWKGEMAEKFGETFLIANKPGERANFKTGSRILCSHSLLPRKFDVVASRTWDLVVVDEAHAFEHSQQRQSMHI